MTNRGPLLWLYTNLQILIFQPTKFIVTVLAEILDTCVAGTKDNPSYVNALRNAYVSTDWSLKLAEGDDAGMGKCTTAQYTLGWNDFITLLVRNQIWK